MMTTEHDTQDRPTSPLEHLVRRLRDFYYSDEYAHGDMSVLHDAADEIERLRDEVKQHYRTQPAAVTWVESDGKRHFREWNPRGCLLQSLMEDGIEWQTLYPRPTNDA